MGPFFLITILSNLLPFGKQRADAVDTVVSAMVD